MASRLPRLFDLTYVYNATGTGVTAYIIDTGILTTHIDFGGRAVQRRPALAGLLLSYNCSPAILDLTPLETCDTFPLPGTIVTTAGGNTLQGIHFENTT